MVLPETLLPAYEGENGRCFSATVSKTDQKILEEFMRSGAFERHLNRMRAQYKGETRPLIRASGRSFKGSYTGVRRECGRPVLRPPAERTPKREAVQRAKRMVCVYGLERYCIGAAADPAQGGTVLWVRRGLLRRDCRGSRDSEKVLECVKKIWKTDCFASNKTDGTNPFLRLIESYQCGTDQSPALRSARVISSDDRSNRLDRIEKRCIRRDINAGHFAVPVSSCFRRSVPFPVIDSGLAFDFDALCRPVWQRSSPAL